MEAFSSWPDVNKVPESYVFPLEQRAGDYVVPPMNHVPVIDMANERDTVLAQIIQASKEFGAFQVINHGVPIRLMDEARAVFKDLFALPDEDTSNLRPGKADPRCILCRSNIDYDKEEIHFWREVLKQKCTPLEECLPFWPEKPAQYREVVTKFVTEVNGLGSALLEMICEGLGLQSRYFANNLSQDLDLLVNYYPPSPDPSLTIGIARHSDRSLMTILAQDDVPGLQVFKEGEWCGVEPISDALIITLGYILQVVSNGQLKNGDHRVVSNSKAARTSAAVFICPTQECIIEPAHALVNAESPQLYRPFAYPEFLQSYSAARQKKLDSEEILQPFRITA